jgi:amino acid transporter
MSASGRPLGLLSLVGIGVNAIVGSSIFLFPGRLSAMLGPASVAAFGLTALLLLPVALCFAKMAGRYDRPGGPYLYATDKFGPLPGYSIGWLCWVTMLVSWAAVANGLGEMTGLGKPAAAAVILAMGGVNYAGVRPGAWTSNLFAAAKLVPLLIFAVAALPKASGFTPFAPHGWSQLGPACFMALFAYSGFETVPVPAGEARDAKRAVPLAVVVSLAISALLYMMVQGAVAGLGGEREISEAAQVVLGPSGAVLITAGGVISMIGYNAGSALGGPRYLIALAEDGHIPRWFGGVRPAVLVSTLAALTAALLLDFASLVDFGAFVLCAQFLTTCAAAGGWTGLLGAGATFWLGSQAGWKQAAGAGAVLAAGLLLRALRRR